MDALNPTDFMPCVDVEPPVVGHDSMDMSEGSVTAPSTPTTPSAGLAENPVETMSGKETLPENQGQQTAAEGAWPDTLWPLIPGPCGFLLLNSKCFGQASSRHRIVMTSWIKLKLTWWRVRGNVSLQVYGRDQSSRLNHRPRLSTLRLI